MDSVDLIRSCLDSIRQISDDIGDAVLYLDAGCSEAFQILGAFPLLLELGVRAVCSLENVSSIDVVVDWNSNVMDFAKKIVVITSRLLSDAHRYILRCLSTHQTVLHCSIYTSISEVAHSAYVDSPLGPDAFREYESLLIQDYEELIKKGKTNKASICQLNETRRSNDGDQVELHSKFDGWSLSSSEEGISETEASFTRGEPDGNNSIRTTEAGEWPRLVVSVHHFPLVLCPLSPRVFVLPSEGAIAEAYLSNKHEDSFSPGLPAIGTGLSSDGDDAPPGATLTAQFLYHLAAKMDLKLDIFSLGDLSKTIGRNMTNMSSLYDVGRRSKRPAGLLLIDRSLDLLTPCCHGDSLVDRVLSSLPRRERISSHVKGSQITKNHTPTTVERASLDVRIPLGRILDRENVTASSTQLLESLTAFTSGWNSSQFGSEFTDFTDQRTSVFGDHDMNHELGLLCGSFLSNESYMGANYLEALLGRRTKDGALLIKKWLLETLRRDKVPLNMKGRLGLTAASELHAMAKLLASNQKSLLKNRGVIQLAVAAEVALGAPLSSRWDALVSAERILRMSSGDTSQDLSSQIRDLINTSILERNEPVSGIQSTQSLLSFQDALLLAVIGYILAGENFPTSGSDGPFTWEEELSLKEAVVDVILEKPTNAKFRFLHGLEEELEDNLRKKSDKQEEVSSTVEDFDDQWGSWDDEDSNSKDSYHNNEQVYGKMQLKLELRDRIDHLFKVFHKLSDLKRRNPIVREGHVALESSFGTDSFSNKGLLYKLVTLVLAKYDIPGLEFHSSAVGRFLKSGFGRFGLGQAKPSLSDHSIILVFVVGGINALEVCEAQEAILESGRPDVELILGGTTILTPDDMFELLLGSSSYI